MLASLPNNGDKSASYVARFDTSAQAQAHASAIRKENGKVAVLDGDGRILSVRADRNVLAVQEIPITTSIAPNSRILVSPSTPDRLSSQDLFTARKAIGLEKLLKKVPRANGLGTKVAVFDSGVEFGVEGLARGTDGKQKTVGFYDLSGYGSVSTTALENQEPASKYTIDGKELIFQGSAKLIQSQGVFDEAEQANRVWLSGFDLNSNSKADERLPLLIGINKNGSPAVWIDANLDGIISPKEEITDFNSTYGYLDLGTSPSGHTPIGVSILSPTSVQFHKVYSGHGTSCALIISGENYVDGQWNGMAPKTQIIGYQLDPGAEDYYDMSQLMRMFLHARDQGVDAISISYIFNTADLSSARFLAEFLTKEVVSRGIVIGFGAGNDGPGLFSAAARDYIPKQSISIGALDPAEQYHTQQGHAGGPADTVPYYSSIGPTRGGRTSPDLLAPTTTMVRGKRNSIGGFHPFSGTSSATPALIGASVAAISALKEESGERIDPYLWKLALENSAHALPMENKLRQGAGAADISEAYELYKKLHAESKAALAAPAKRAHFPFELRASTVLEGNSMEGEGLILTAYRPSAAVSVRLAEASAARIDTSVFASVLELSHSGTFFTTPSQILLEGRPASFSVEFSPELAHKPGVYTDVIQVRRPTDGLVLLRIPVVAMIAAPLGEAGEVVEVDTTLQPHLVLRKFVELKRPTALAFQGLVSSRGGPANFGVLKMEFLSRGGLSSSSQYVSLNRDHQLITHETELLPAGKYEWVAYHIPVGPPPFSYREIKLTGAIGAIPLRLISGPDEKDEVLTTVVEALSKFTMNSAKLELRGERKKGKLLRYQEVRAQSPGYRGGMDLGSEQKSLKVLLSQEGADRALEPFLHVEIVVLRAGDKKILARTTSAVNSTQATTIPLSEPARDVEIIAYPNVVNWQAVKTQSLSATVETSWPSPVVLEKKFDPPLVIQTGQATSIDFPGATAKIPENAHGLIEVLGDDSDRAKLAF